MIQNSTAFTLDFAPILQDSLLYGLVATASLLLLVSVFFYRRGLIWRTICCAAFFMLCLNPSLVEEKRDIVPDVAVIVVDRSTSQTMGDRTARTDKALEYLRAGLDDRESLQLRVIESDQSGGLAQRETRLFDKLDQTLTDVPATRRAGVIFLTDGQVHDVPTDPQRYSDYGPVHALLTGERTERDRQLVIVEVPAYGIVGQDITIRYRVEDAHPGSDGYASVVARQDNAAPRTSVVPVNQEQSLTIKIDHAGQNIIDLEVAGVPGELTLANNRVPLVINGVRDRLRVLLVSGQPHAGGRTWRNLLTSDPGVDLVHFTILRDPTKLDATPQHELALIAFPFQELFEIKLYDFDLIIFDRYRLNNILPDYYFGNIARYVREGGALLEASGPSFAQTEDSIYATALSSILPAAPTGQVYEQPYNPTLTAVGKRHPVTQNLSWSAAGAGTGGDNDDNDAAVRPWGRWLRQVGITPESGDIVMTGVGEAPLLVLDHVEKGRVAQLASDQIWLWARGYEGGGPQGELLRRLAHWLMKEPELEENALTVTVEDGFLSIQRRALSGENMDVIVTAPDGKQTTVTLTAGPDGQLVNRVPADQLGVYTVNDGTQTRFALVGALNPPELTGIKTTESKLKPLVDHTGGSLIWLEKTPQPGIRFLPADRTYGGADWLGLRENRSYNVTGVKNRPFLPEWAYALGLLALVIGSWWLEGRTRTRRGKGATA